MNTVCMPSMHPMTLYDRVSRLLESVEWCDCTFRVGSETIRAHKLILAISSPVFKAMLYGTMAEPKEIVISDIDPDIFQLMLDFIYKDKGVIESLEVACALLYAAKKYMLPYLIDVCINYIKNSMNMKNVVSILPFCEWMQEEDLVIQCVSLICKHAETILTPDMEHISGASLQKILQQDRINMEEKDLICLAIRWAKNECIERKLVPNFDNRRSMLIESGNLCLLRFHTLTRKDMDWVNNLNILNDQEKMTILKVLAEKKSLSKEIDIVEESLQSEPTVIEKPTLKVFKCDPENPLNLSTETRLPARVDWVYSYRSSIRSASPLFIEDGAQSIKVSIWCHKTTFIHSLAIPTRLSVDVSFSTPSQIFYYKENIELKISAINDPKHQITVKFVGRLGYNTSSSAYIDLPKPFIFKENECYSVSFTWPELTQPQYTYPLSYRPTMSSDGLFTFDDNYELTTPCGSFIEGLKICV